MDDMLNTNIVISIIISTASLMTAIGIIIGCLRAAFKQTDKWNGYDEQIKNIEEQIQGLRDEQLMQTHVLWATLEGLHQLGCNGEVTQARNELNEYLNVQTHKKPSVTK